MRAFHFVPLVLATALFPLAAEAQNLLKNASFEQPKIKGRVLAIAGGDPSSIEGETTWGHFQTMDSEGKVQVGMTDSVARTGTQSIFVDFTKASRSKEAFLMSTLTSVKPQLRYRVSIWGLIDKERPLTLGNERPLLRLQVEFYKEDEETQVGNTEHRTQMIPGSKRRMLFIPGKWNEFYATVKAPEEAALMKVSFTWDVPGENGVADGVIYFDDAAVALTTEEENDISKDLPPEKNEDEGPALLPPGATLPK